VKTLETSDCIAECLRILRQATEPIFAADIAARLGLGGNRETQRRHVRAFIKHLRDNGSRIIATLHGGYWLTDDAQLWADYLEGRQIDAKKILGETHRRKRVAYDSRGQGSLFGPRFATGLG